VTLPIRTPDLRAAFFVAEEGEALAVGGPAGAVTVLISDENFLLASGGGDDPDVRGLRVGIEVDVDHAEDDPLAVGRDDGLADALQLHHVFEGEGMLGLGEGGEGEGDDCKNEQEETAHKGTSMKIVRREIACYVFWQQFERWTQNVASNVSTANG
jgi:hypothetical protein